MKNERYKNWKSHHCTKIVPKKMLIGTHRCPAFFMHTARSMKGITTHYFAPKLFDCTKGGANGLIVLAFTRKKKSRDAQRKKRRGMFLSGTKVFPPSHLFHLLPFFFRWTDDGSCRSHCFCDYGHAQTEARMLHHWGRFEAAFWWLVFVFKFLSFWASLFHFKNQKNLNKIIFVPFSLSFSATLI